MRKCRRCIWRAGGILLTEAARGSLQPAAAACSSPTSHGLINSLSSPRCEPADPGFAHVLLSANTCKLFSQGNLFSTSSLFSSLIVGESQWLSFSFKLGCPEDLLENLVFRKDGQMRELPSHVLPGVATRSSWLGRSKHLEG